MADVVKRHAGRKPNVTKTQAPDMPEWIVIPDWAKTGIANQWLRNWIIPEALRRGYKTVWIRATAEHKHYLPPVRLTPEPQEVYIAFVDSANPPEISNNFKLTDVNWDVFPQANEGHLLLDAVEIRWGNQNAVLFNEEVDISIFDWKARLEELGKKYPGAHGGAIRHADGTKTDNPAFPRELEDHLKAQPDLDYDYGFIKWRIDKGQQWIYNTPEILKDAGVQCESGETSAPTPADAIQLIAEDNLRFRVVDTDTPHNRAYTLIATINASALKKILSLTGGGHGNLAQEETARLTDTLVLKCSNPDKLNMELTDKADESTIPVTTLTEFRFNISTKFAIAPKGVAFEIGTQSLFLQPVNLGEWKQWYSPDKTLEDLVRDSKEVEAQASLTAENGSDTAQELVVSTPEPASTPPLPQGDKLPDNTPQYTCEEFRALGYAMADTSTLRYWTIAEKDSNLSILSMLYQRPGERIEVKFDPGGLTTDLRTGLQLDTTNAVKEFLQQRGFRGNLVLQMLGKAAILKTDEAIELDDFVNKLFDPRTAKDRQAARAWVWDTIRTILAIRLYGTRAGVYKDPNTKKLIDLTFRGEPFIVLSPGARMFAQGQHSFWPDSDIPVTVGFTMGAWGKAIRKNQAAILAHFGKLDDVLSIPAGKPAGAWAQVILFNLNQKWREKAKDVRVTTHTRTDGNGTDRKVIATRWPHAFTRRQLLCDLCPPAAEFSVMDMLNGNKPIRAKKYWNAAIKILQTEGLISYYKELEALPKGTDGKPKRKGWQDDWLDQPLDIRPNEDGKKAAIEIKTSHQKALTARKRKPKNNGPKP